MKAIWIVSVLLLFSCSAQKQTLVFIKHIPYCGGAKPTPEMTRGTVTMASKTKFAITKKGDKKIVKWIVTDTSGTWTGKLNTGTYDIYRAEKFWSNKELITHFKLVDTDFYRFNGEKCLDSWKLQPDYSFESKNSGSIHVELKGKCFVGFSPCFDYIGPKVQ